MGATADDRLHTDRSWVDGVIGPVLKTTGELFGRPQPNPTVKVSTTAEHTYSQKILDKFKTQRTAFERAGGERREFRSNLKITSTTRCSGSP